MDQKDLGLSLLYESVAEGALDALGVVGDAVLVEMNQAGTEEELACVTEGLGAGDAGIDGVLGKLLVVDLNVQLEALEAVNLEGVLGLVDLAGLGLCGELTDILLHDQHCGERFMLWEKTVSENIRNCIGIACSSILFEKNLDATAPITFRHQPHARP